MSADLLAAADEAARNAYAPYSSFYVGAAATAGLKPGDLEEIAITASPCGGCRQGLAEWRLDKITYRRGTGEVATVTPAELLPDSFVL